MKDIQSLVARLSELDDLLANCMKCGLCQGVCPVFAESNRESDVARGKIYLLEGLASRMITDAGEVKNRIENCILCGTCAANCPSGVNALEIFLLARSILTDFIGLSAVKKAIFRGLIVHPGLFNSMMDLAKTFQGLLFKPANPDTGTYCSRAFSSLIGDRHFIPLASRPFHKDKSYPTTAPAGSSNVVFFPGCVVDKIYPDVARKAVNHLRGHEAAVVVPETQICCGIPSLAAGDKKSFAALFQQNMTLFSKLNPSYLVTPCATCTSTIKKIWPLMADDLNLELKTEAQQLAEKTVDISEFLVDVLRVSPPALPNGRGKRVTYHDPCHLGKSLGVVDQPRQLIKANPDNQLIEMKDADVCCGNGGSFNLQHYETSESIGNKKCRNIIDTTAEIVATSCPACMIQLTDLLSKAGSQIAVKHTIELI